jgi:predicted TIM-barrel fold metal-dependent hydrolase
VEAKRVSTFSLEIGGIDAWINPNTGLPPARAAEVEYLFPDMRDRVKRGTTLEQLIDEMDEAGLSKAVLCSGYGGADNIEWVRKAVATHPDRFAFSAVVDPNQGMRAVRFVEELVQNDNCRLVRMLALENGMPYNDARYYPVYAKCIELGVPVGLNVGVPGPTTPAKHQHPLTVDEVCSFFPELTVVLQHGGEPWEALCVKLMVKYANLYYMTSAFAPKYIPQAIIDFANTRGADRIMFASDYPLLSLSRCTSEAVHLPFRDQERFDSFISGNAQRMFFS